MAIRFFTILFCTLLIVTVVSRYKVEAAVRDVKADIAEIGHLQRTERTRISQLRLDVEVLESRQRLAELARAQTDLYPVKAAQMHSAREFAHLIDMPYGTLKKAPKNEEFILNAIAMANLTTSGTLKE